MGNNLNTFLLFWTGRREWVKVGGGISPPIFKFPCKSNEYTHLSTLPFPFIPRRDVEFGVSPFRVFLVTDSDLHGCPYLRPMKEELTSLDVEWTHVVTCWSPLKTRLLSTDEWKPTSVCTIFHPSLPSRLPIRHEDGKPSSFYGLKGLSVHLQHPSSLWFRQNYSKLGSSDGRTSTLWWSFTDI